MIKDPKQIVTPFAFSVHPDLLGQPLASPKRRLFAILIDLLIAYLLAGLGNLFLAAAVTFLIFWIVIRTRSKSTFKNFLRYTGAAVSSLFVFSLAIGILETFNPSYSDLNIDPSISTGQDINWEKFGEQMANMDYTNPDNMEKQLEELEKVLEFEEEEAPITVNFPPRLPELLNDFETALANDDSMGLDVIRPELALILAKPELDKLDKELEELDERFDEVRVKNAELSEQIENPSLYIATKRALKMAGLSLGWVGLYFITTIAFFKGQTLGKRLLKIRVVRLNNKPIGLFFAFERFGGYAAGIATGFLGFFQVYWDANRQAIHDKIAGTVVIDLRESKKEKTEHIRNEVLDNENLLSQF